jgi:hypothetical protein
MVHNDLVKWLKEQLDDKEYKWLFISHETTQDYTGMVYECREASLITFDGYIPLQETIRYRLTPAGESALGIQASDGAEDARYIVIGKPYPPEDLELVEELMFDDFVGINYEAWLQLHRKHGDNLCDLFTATTWILDDVVSKMMDDMQVMDAEFAELGAEYRAMNQPDSTPASENTATGEYHTGYDKDGKVALMDANNRVIIAAPETEWELIGHIASSLNTETATLRSQLAAAQAENKRLAERVRDLKRDVDNLTDALHRDSE